MYVKVVIRDVKGVILVRLKTLVVRVILVIAAMVGVM